MRLVWLAPFGLQPKGTTRVRMLPLARAMVARGHEITLLIPPWDDRAAAGQRRLDAGVEVIELPLPPTPLLDPVRLPVDLLRRARAARPELVHLFKPKGYGALAGMGWRALRRLGRERAPLVIDSDDWEGAGGWNDLAGYPWPARALFARQERWALDRADGLTVASRALESLALAAGRDPARTLYLPNGPGARWERPPDAALDALRHELGLGDAPIALLFTRFFEFDPARVARLWAQVVARRPAARLLVVGRGLRGEERAFARAIAAGGVTDSVVDAGWQPMERVGGYLALARVALYPMDDTLVNRTKCPVKLADYLQAGIPVVGEAVGQVGEYLFDGQGGIVVEPGDAERFVAATVELLDDPARGAALGAAGRARLATHFDWPVAATRLERFYEQLLG